MFEYLSNNIIIIYISIAMLSYITPGPDWLIITKNIIRAKKMGFILL